MMMINKTAVIKLFILLIILPALNLIVAAQQQNDAPPEVTFSNKLSFNAFSRRAELPFSEFDAKLKFNDSASKTESPAAQTVWKYERPTRQKRVQKYLNRTVGVYALLATAGGAAISHAADYPEEWENDIKGFGRRFASNLGQNAIQETTIFGLDEAFKIDSAFYRKGKSETFNKRFANAVLSTVTARKPNGKRIIGLPRIIGTYTSNIIAAEAWYPNKFDYKDGFRNGSVSLGINAGVNLLREFVFGGK